MSTTAKSPWPDLESGLPNDIDAWIVNAKFGKNENYTAGILTKSEDETQGTQLMFDLVDENGEIQGSVGYSVGTGWTVSDDGAQISHAKRLNVVRSTRYGGFQERIIEKLKVDMNKIGGSPTVAATWNGLGFHWMQEEMTTVGGKKVQVLMPTLFISKRDIQAAKPAEAGGGEDNKISKELEDELTKLVKANTIKQFQLKAMSVKEAIGNDTLMASILDDGPDGFYAKHKA